MTHQLIQTPLYSISVPRLFEKMLVAGQLLRLERMDRAGGEGSFAEVNLFVGFTDEEKIEDPPKAGPGEVNEALLAALWQRYDEGEAALGGLELVETASGPGTRCSLVRLPKTSWRPESGALVWIFVPQAETRHVFARLVLEFDWSLRSLYEPIGRALVDSIAWKSEAIGEADVVELASFGWSIFDAMEPSQREGIAHRYREVLGQQLAAPEEKQEPRLLELASMDLDELTVQGLEELLVADGSRGRQVLLEVDFFPGPIEVTIDSLDADGYELGPGTIGILRALKGLGDKDRPRAAELLWEHCKICFDATDYGAPEGQSNEEYFGIHGPEDALRETGPGTIYLSERLGGGFHDLFEVCFYPPWEEEHGCSLVVRDGKFHAFSDPGGWLGEFELQPLE